MTLKRIPAAEVALGMYIESFDGSWLAHPFWRRGFHVTALDDLERVRASKVAAVIIDEAKSKASAQVRPAPRSSATPVDMPAHVATDRVPERIARSRSSPGPVWQAAALTPFTRYVPTDDEAPPTAAAEHAALSRMLGESTRLVRQAFDGIARGEHLALAEFDGIVTDLSAAMARNPALMIGISRLKSKDEYTFLHSVSVGALMIGLGRTLGLDEAAVRDLGFGGLVHDVGKMAVDSTILHKPGPLTDAEFATMKQHPELGHRILLRDAAVSPIALEVTLRHHERLDGSGYPGGLSGDAVSLYARIAAICDVFDALTSARVYKEALSAHDAVAMMASWEGHLDRDLLLVFMRSIGTYPAGMLVRLSSQRLGVVLPPARRPGRPRVRAFHCAASDTPLQSCDLVIADKGQGERVIAEERIEDWPAAILPSVSRRRTAAH